MIKEKLPTNELSQLLLRKRIEQDITQKEMAKLIGISYPTYFQIEKGIYEASLKIIIKIANFLNMEPSKVFEMYNGQKM